MLKCFNDDDDYFFLLLLLLFRGFSPNENERKSFILKEKLIFIRFRSIRFLHVFCFLRKFSSFFDVFLTIDAFDKTMPKKTSDSNKPRGPVSAYALFVQTCRSELRRKYPQLAVDYNVIVKKCSERWKAMNENEKKRFNDTAEFHRKRYKEELATYQQEQQAKQQQQQSATSSILLPTSSNAFLIDSCSVVPQLPNQGTTTHPLLMSTTNLPGGTTLMTSVTSSPTVPSAVAPIPPKKPPRKRKPKDPHAPKKPLSAYFLFCADERPKVHGSQSGEMIFFDFDIGFLNLNFSFRNVRQ